MLDSAERRLFADTFQVADEQVARDHLISHTLAAIASLGLSLVFYGGTALARTHLPTFRLSEDIDLLAADRRATVCGRSTKSERSHRPSWPCCEACWGGRCR
jgi:predicted nucleotidyltransferase component of viral defense system